MKKILIVEDEQTLQEVYSTLFTFEKFEVYRASNGKEAIEQLKKHKPDIIVLDILMPIMGGLQFLEKTKPKENYPDIKILALSNLSDPDTLKEIDRLGATRYMLKASASPHDLIANVREMLKQP